MFPSVGPDGKMLRYKISSSDASFFRSVRITLPDSGVLGSLLSLVPSPVPRFFRKFFFKIQRLRANLSHRFVLPLRITVFLNFSLTLIPKLRRKISVFPKKFCFPSSMQKNAFSGAPHSVQTGVFAERRAGKAHISLPHIFQSV